MCACARVQAKIRRGNNVCLASPLVAAGQCFQLEIMYPLIGSLNCSRLCGSLACPAESSLFALSQPLVERLRGQKFPFRNV